MNVRPEACMACGGGPLTWSTERVQVPFLDRARRECAVSVDVPVARCAACGEATHPAEAAGIRHSAVCRARGLLAPADIVAARRSMGMTQLELAEATGLGIASIRRWECGTAMQTVANDRALRWALGDSLAMLRPRLARR